jgi:hypothetical protein
MMKTEGWRVAIVPAILYIVLTSAAAFGAAEFNFQRELSGNLPTLSVQVTDVDTPSGTVSVSGSDSRRPAVPFTFDWGDGSTSAGFFPQTHAYAKPLRDHIISVTAHYDGGDSDEAHAEVFFVPPVIHPVPCPDALRVTIPDHNVDLSTRLYSLPPGLGFFVDSCFTTVPRSTFEYVLTLAAMIQMDFANQDVFLPDGTFNQIVLRGPKSGGMNSLWFTTPVSFAAGDRAFGKSQAEYSSFFHEMGHNISLNSPAAYCYGGKIDGNANAILSEAVAQIFQHATAFEIINRAGEFGLDPASTEAIRSSAIASMMLVRRSYEDYVSSGMRFCSWNDPNTQVDETFGTFMTIACEFGTHAEQGGTGYRSPVKRMMELLQVFDPELHRRYDQHHNTAEADAFRSTLMVSALSYAFNQDLRPTFRALQFPIDDALHTELITRADKKGSSPLGGTASSPR